VRVTAAGRSVTAELRTRELGSPTEAKSKVGLKQLDTSAEKHVHRIHFRSSTIPISVDVSCILLYLLIGLLSLCLSGFGIRNDPKLRFTL